MVTNNPVFYCFLTYHDPECIHAVFWFCLQTEISTPTPSGVQLLHEPPTNTDDEATDSAEVEAHSLLHQSRWVISNQHIRFYSEDICNFMYDVLNDFMHLSKTKQCNGSLCAAVCASLQGIILSWKSAPLWSYVIVQGQFIAALQKSP